MLLTSQSFFFSLTALFSLAQAQPHARIHQHGASKRATDTTGVVSGRGIVYAVGNTGMGALAGKLSFSTDWSAWAANPTNADLGTFVPHVWGLDNAQNDFLTAFLQAAPSFPKGSTVLGFNEGDMISGSWMTPQQAVDNWSGINNLRDAENSIGAKVCTPCPSNGVETGTSGVGSVTLQYQPSIDQGIHWMTEFLAAASGHYKFDCLCTNWYGGYGAATLEADQALIEQQIGELVTLADQYGIEDIVLAEMQRPNPDQECEFVAWFQETFLTDAFPKSGNRIKAYSYNYNKFTLTNGDTLTPVGEAYVGDIGYGSCPN